MGTFSFMSFSAVKRRAAFSNALRYLHMQPFSIKRKAAELVVPATPTPRKWEALSDIDDQQGMRFQMATLHFFKHNPSMSGVDPVKVIKEAFAKALVFYYPFAGRIREVASSGKLVVECNEEGAHFVEADADVRLDQLECPVGPMEMFPFMGEFVSSDDHTMGTIGCPLLLIQVTRLNCGGFTVGCQYTHTMADAHGIAQLLNAIAELARGQPTLSVAPVWARHLLLARNPPVITRVHPEYQKEYSTQLIHQPPTQDMVAHSFFFKTKDISVLLNQLPPHMRSTTTKFEVLTASVWRALSISQYFNDPELPVRVLFAVDGRRGSKVTIPVGYYGNVVAFPAAITTVSKLVSQPLSYAVELVQKAKKSVTEEYMRSTADLMVLRGRPRYEAERAFMVTDLTNSNLNRIDFGWGEPADLHIVSVEFGSCFNRAVGYHIRGKNSDGEGGILVPIYLPKMAVGRLVKEIDGMIKNVSNVDQRLE